MDNCITQGKAVPPEMIRPFTESSDLLGNTAALTARLKEDGYLFFRGALDKDEVFAARAEIFERLAAVGEVKDPPAEGIFSGASRRQEMANDLGEFWKSVCKGPKLRQVTHGPRLRNLMAGVFGEPARPHDYIFLRPSPVGRATPVHYDRPFFSRGSERINTVWLALGPVPVADGSLECQRTSKRHLLLSVAGG